MTYPVRKSLHSVDEARQSMGRLVQQLDQRDLCNTIDDPGDGGTFDVSRSGIAYIVTGASNPETCTLPDPTFGGQMLGIVQQTHGGGDRIISCASVLDVASSTTLTFSAAGQSVLLYGVCIGGDYQWRVICYDGATVT